MPAAEPTRVVRLGMINGSGLLAGTMGVGVLVGVVGTMADGGAVVTAVGALVESTGAGTIEGANAFKSATGAFEGATDALSGPSEGAGTGEVVFVGNTTTEDPMDGEKEKEVTSKVTGLPFLGPSPKFCHALRCRRSKPVGLGIMVLSAGDHDAA
jgi:hypothetical protein